MREHLQKTRPNREYDSESLVNEAKTAIDAHDASGFAALFAPDGRVTDDTMEHVGWVAISRWFAMTLPIHLDTLESRADGDSYTLIANGHGDYPGSPVTFRYDFVLSHAGIDSLSISLADAVEVGP